MSASQNITPPELVEPTTAIDAVTYYKKMLKTVKKLLRNQTTISNERNKIIAMQRKMLEIQSLEAQILRKKLDLLTAAIRRGGRTPIRGRRHHQIRVS